VRPETHGEALIEVVPAPKYEDVIMTWDWACNAMLGACVGVNEILGDTPAARSSDRSRSVSNVDNCAGRPCERTSQFSPPLPNILEPGLSPAGTHQGCPSLSGLRPPDIRSTRKTAKHATPGHNGACAMQEASPIQQFLASFMRCRSMRRR
jgi:hypothetical protein